MVDGVVGTSSSQGPRHDRLYLPAEERGDVPPPKMQTPKPESLSEAGRAPEPEITLTQRMFSAVAGSFLTSILVTPLDVVRVRLQSQSQTPTFNDIRNSSSTPLHRSFSNLPPNLGVTSCCREVFWVNNHAPYCVVGDGAVYASVQAATGAPDAASSTLGAECAVEETQRKTFTSTLDGIRKIARNEGLSTLWRGLSPTLVMAVPGNIIYFAGYDWLRTSDKSPVKGRVSELYSPLVAGSTARVIAAFFVSPIELFRTRMQAAQGGGAADAPSRGLFRETARGVTDMVRNQGYHTLWRGLSLTLWRDVPFSALYWWGYEIARDAITVARGTSSSASSNTRISSPETMGSAMNSRVDARSRQNRTTTLLDSFAAGALSGGCAAVITTPFDVGKTRQQVHPFSGDGGRAASALSAAPKGPEQSMPRFLWSIFTEEGAAGLFRGCTARVLKVAPACAIMISTYEMGKKMAVEMREEEVER